MTRKGLMKSIPKIYLTWNSAAPIFLLTKETRIPRGPTIGVSKSTPGFMLQTDFVFFNVESIRGFTPTFVNIYSSTSHPFGFLSIIKCTPLDVLQLLVTALMNKDDMVALIQVD